MYGPELEARGLEGSDRAGADATEPLEVGLAGLDPRDLPVVADAELAQPERAQGRLAARELGQPLRGDLGAVRNARRQARLLGLVPGRQIHLAAQLADLRLGQAGVREWLHHPVLVGRLQPGAIVCELLGVGARDD